MGPSSDILFERRGVAGIITLNRPKALNAITLPMVHALAEQLELWARDGAVTRVILTAAGGRAFCAGGDIRALYDLGRAGRYDEALKFWHDEYRLNATIKKYPKPYVALIDGVVMGGGVGVSVHGSHRVAGDKFVFAMPEVGIGFFPDVGATWFLPRMPGELGTYCALTGERLAAADGVGGGIATHRVTSARLPELLDALCGNVPVDALLSAFAYRSAFAESSASAEGAAQRPVVTLRPAIDRLFAADTVSAILAGLDAEAAAATADAEWAAATAAKIRTKAPMSLTVALAQLRRGRSWSFEECMRAEFRIVSRFVRGHDFYEGVRAAIIDKDNRPCWQPATLAEVDAAAPEHHFAPLDRELTLP
jgi:enoyl-CoA hydratase/carnithine racemase